MIQPIATAFPNGDFRINRSHRWIPTPVLQDIETAEQAHRNRLAEQAMLITREFYPTLGAETIGLRRAARMANIAGLRRDNRTDAERRRSSRSRR